MGVAILSRMSSLDLSLFDSSDFTHSTYAIVLRDKVYPPAKIDTEEHVKNLLEDLAGIEVSHAGCKPSPVQHSDSLGDYYTKSITRSSLQLDT